MTAAARRQRARAEALGATTFVIPDHLVPMMAPIPYLATVAAAHRAAPRSPPSSTTTTSATRRSSPRTWRRSTSCRRPPRRRDRGRLEQARVRRDRPAVRPDRGSASRGWPRRSPSSRAASASGPFSFAGEHYTITDYDGQPKPVQQPHPPFFIGGGGRRTLTLAAREADIVGLAPRTLKEQRGDPRSLTWAATEEKIGWVREAAGDRFDDLVFNVYPSQWPITVTDDLRGEARKVIDRMKERTGIELTEDEVIASPHIFIGSIERFVEKFQELRERLGISSFMVGSLDELGPVVERLAGT